MRKTSVYLSEQTKTALHDASVRWGRSEAEIIRQAIERYVGGADGRSDDASGANDGVDAGSDRGATAAPMSRSAVPVATTAPGVTAAAGAPSDRLVGPRLIGVGVGPSAPDLMTQRAINVLKQADRVFVASTAPDAIARAEAIVRVAVPTVIVDRLPLSVASDADSFESGLDAAAQVLIDALDRGQVVAFIGLGDPNVFSTFPALARRVARLRPDVPVTTVPGIMSFQELAARTGTVLAEGEERVELLTLNQGLIAMEAALDQPDCTVVLYKGGRHLPAVAGRLRDHRRLDGAVIGEMMGLPGGRSGSVADVCDRPASYLATVVIPATRPVPQ